MITITRPVNPEKRFCEEYEFLLGEDDKPLSFWSIKEMLQYLADRNFTLEELAYPNVCDRPELIFNIEESE